MGWYERMEQASFKGVVFYVDSHSVTMRRRVPVRKLAGKDGSVQQDLGRDPDEHTITAFLWGDDYDLARDELEAVLLEPGPGALVLPTRGEIWARITQGPETHENRKAGGYCTIRFSFVNEDRGVGILARRVDTSAQLATAASAVRDAAIEDFEQAYNPRAMPEKYQAITRDALDVAADTLRTAQAKVAGVVALVDRVGLAIDALDSAGNTIMSTPSLLVTTLIALTDSVIGLGKTFVANIERTTGLVGLGQSPYDLSKAVRDTVALARSFALLGQDAPETGTTELAAQSARNTRAVYRVVRAGALARQAEIYAQAAFDSSTLAVNVLRDMSREIDALMAYGTSDDLFQSLADLRAAASAHLLWTAASLPEAIVYTPKRELPAVLIAHDLYADATREREIVARNRIPHPLFVSGALEVLTQ